MGGWVRPVLADARSLDEALARLRLEPVAGRFAPLGEEELVALESAVGCGLPDLYRWFLSTYGRCGFDAIITIDAVSGESLPFLMFFGAAEADSTGGIMWTLEAHRDLFGPEATFGPHEPPIGDDEFGDLYVMDAAVGAITFRPSYGPPVDVARDFVDLISRMVAEIEVV